MSFIRQTVAVSIVAMIVAAAATPAAGQLILHVDDDASTNGHGHSWSKAFRCLQDALHKAYAADGRVTEIRVAGGIYTPDQDEIGNVTPGDRGAGFGLLSGVAVKGGYAGWADPPNPNRRDIAAYQTILSGDLAGDDGPDFANNGENSWNVVIGSGTDDTAVLDGFTITGGNADGSGSNWDGGGMYNYAGNPTVTNCTFVWNIAVYGGAICNYESSPMLTDCTLSWNMAVKGGAIYNSYASPTLTRCVLSWNRAYAYGGGVYNILSDPALANCLLTDNRADHGGGMFNCVQSAPTLINCLFARNRATGYG